MVRRHRTYRRHQWLRSQSPHAGKRVGKTNPTAIQAVQEIPGGLAVMSSRRGEVVVKVEATNKSPRGTVFCSFSFSDVPINALTGSGYDPITDTAELKVCPVRIEPASTVPV